MVTYTMLATPSLGIAQEATQSQSSVQPGDVETTASRVYVFVDKTGFGHQHGVEAKLAKSTLNLGATENAGQLVFDMQSFNADTPAARKYVGLAGVTDEATRTAVNQNMKGEAILNVKRFPTATFDIISAKPTGKLTPKGLPLYQLDGKFTLHGVTHLLSITAEARQKKGWLHVRGNFTILQTDYQITPYSKALGAVGVANPLRIYGDLYVAPTSHVNMASIPEGA
jgi:polyisoprenoid-binding protein YceI